MNFTMKNLMFWMVAALVIFLFWSVSSRIQKEERHLSFSDFLGQVEAEHVANVTIIGSDAGSEILGDFKNGQGFRTYAPPQFDNLVNTLLDKGVVVRARGGSSSSWSAHLINWAPIVIMIAFLMFFGRLARGTPDLATMNRIWEALASSDEDLSLDELSSRLSLRSKPALKRALFQMLREGTVLFTAEKKYRVKSVE